MLFLLLLGTLVVLLLAYAVRDSLKPDGYPPGPVWIPLMGCYPQFRILLRKLGYCHLVWANLAERFGPLVGLRLGKDRIVVVSGFQAIKHVSSREDCDGRPDGFFFRMRTFHQRLGVAFVDGNFWSEQRKFTTRHLRNLGLSGNALESIILKEVDALKNELELKCAQNRDLEIELHNLFDISILNSLWAVVAGKRFELGDSKLLKIFELQHASFRALDMSGGLINQMPFLRFVAPEKSGYNTLMATLDTNYSFLKETLADHKKAFQKGQHSDLIDAYLDEIENNKMSASNAVNFHDLQLLALCMDLFMAGSETTSNTLGCLMLKFLEYPEMQTRVQWEIDAVVGRERLPTVADRPKLVYLEAMIMEAQRLICVAPVAVPHRTMQDCQILGSSVPKDTTLLLSIWSVHMDTNHWIDPENFRPERFLNEAQDAIVKDDWFIPFGLGKRRCLGETLARHSLFLFLAGLLQKFSFLTPPSGLPELNLYDGITLAPRPFTGIIRTR